MDLREIHTENNHEVFGLLGQKYYSRDFGDLIVNFIFEDENCPGIFATNFHHPSGECVPLLYLHCSECWLGSGRSCTESAGNTDKQQKVVINTELDFNTLHVHQDTVVTLRVDKQYQLNWEEAVKIIQEHANFQLV